MSVSVCFAAMERGIVGARREGYISESNAAVRMRRGE